MTDFHSHILPGIDDGSTSIEESLLMLGESARQGVDRIVATPHFYPKYDTPERFISRRERAYESLLPHLNSGLPRVYLGAEVYYFDGIGTSLAVDCLTVNDSGLMLLEMPFAEWSERMLREVIAAHDRLPRGIVLAHVDRYIKFQKPQVWQYLAENGIMMQMNADAFVGRGFFERRRIFRLVEYGLVQFIGSDTHNMTSRKPNIADSVGVIRERFGEEFLEASESYADVVLKHLDNV